MAEYKVKFDVFEGPLDLLLYLIKKEEVDIYAVNLTRIATQFIEYVEVMRQLDLDIAGEFLVMASTLMYIKSRELLPVDLQAQVEDEEDGEDPRWELIRQLVEYKKFKDAASELQTLEGRQENVFARLPAKIEFEPESKISSVIAIASRWATITANRSTTADAVSVPRGLPPHRTWSTSSVSHQPLLIATRPMLL